MKTELLQQSMQVQYDLLCSFSDRAFDEWQKEKDNPDSLFRAHGCYCTALAQNTGAHAIENIAMSVGINLKKNAIKIQPVLDQQIKQIQHELSASVAGNMAAV